MIITDVLTLIQMCHIAKHVTKCHHWMLTYMASPVKNQICRGIAPTLRIWPFQVGSCLNIDCRRLGKHRTNTAVCHRSVSSNIGSANHIGQRTDYYYSHSAGKVELITYPKPSLAPTDEETLVKQISGDDKKAMDSKSGVEFICFCPLCPAISLPTD
jgi:hypothetical protein